MLRNWMVMVTLAATAAEAQETTKLHPGYVFVTSSHLTIHFAH